MEYIVEGLEWMLKGIVGVSLVLIVALLLSGCAMTPIDAAANVALAI